MPDGRVLACGDSSGLLRLANTVNGAILAESNAHAGGVQGVRFTRDGRRVITCGSDSRVALWDLRMKEG